MVSIFERQGFALLLVCYDSPACDPDRLPPALRQRTGVGNTSTALPPRSPRGSAGRLADTVSSSGRTGSRRESCRDPPDDLRVPVRLLNLAWAPAGMASPRVAGRAGRCRALDAPFDDSGPRRRPAGNHPRPLFPRPAGTHSGGNPPGLSRACLRSCAARRRHHRERRLHEAPGNRAPGHRRGTNHRLHTRQSRMATTR